MVDIPKYRYAKMWILHIYEKSQSFKSIAVVIAKNFILRKTVGLGDLTAQSWLVKPKLTISWVKFTTSFFYSWSTHFFLLFFFLLNRPSVSRNDNMGMQKVNGSQIYEQKQYLIFPLRDILDVINGSSINDKSSFNLRWSCPFHCFIVF